MNPVDSPQPTGSRWAWLTARANAPLAALVVVAIVLRAGALIVPHSYFPDEIFQYLEPAHRLVFGPGVVTWDYRYGVRSELLPLLLTGPMWLGGAISPSGGLYLLLPKLALLALSLPLLWAAYELGRRLSAVHALLAVAVAATWYEFIYFATQALTESLAAIAILIGAALLVERRHLKACGAMLALGVVLRFQYGPAVVALLSAGLWNELRRLEWRPLANLAAGGAIVLLFSATVDVVTGHFPFDWLAENFYQNIMVGRSHAWTSGPLFYLQAIVATWGPWLIFMVPLAVIGARRYPALFVCALTNIAVHSVIAHKEYRYILLSTMILALLAAIGTADVIHRLSRAKHIDPRRLRLIAIAGWMAASISVATGAEARGWWTAGRPLLDAFTSIRKQGALCGVALDGIHWSETGGYTYLHRPIPLMIYNADQKRQLAADAAGFNAIVAPGDTAVPPGYTRDQCFPATPGRPSICIFRRPGSCASPSSAEINRTLVRIDR
jgi:hypothetical protein